MDESSIKLGDLQNSIEASEDKKLENEKTLASINANIVQLQDDIKDVIKQNEKLEADKKGLTATRKSLENEVDKKMEPLSTKREALLKKIGKAEANLEKHDQHTTIVQEKKNSTGIPR